MLSPVPASVPGSHPGSTPWLFPLAPDWTLGPIRLLPLVILKRKYNLGQFRWTPDKNPLPVSPTLTYNERTCRRKRWYLFLFLEVGTDLRTFFLSVYDEVDIDGLGLFVVVRSRVGMRLIQHGVRAAGVQWCACPRVGRSPRQEGHWTEHFFLFF